VVGGLVGAVGGTVGAVELGCGFVVGTVVVDAGSVVVAAVVVMPSGLPWTTGAGAVDVVVDPGSESSWSTC